MSLRLQVTTATSRPDRDGRDERGAAQLALRDEPARRPWRRRAGVPVPVATSTVLLATVGMALS